MLEASAGTGKTFALAGLVTRYVAEGEATLDQMLLITFGRAASQELRERVRSQILDALLAFDDPSTVGDNELVRYLLEGTPEELTERRQRLRDALAGFDAATIATTHQFCQLVLKSLGVAGDTDAGVHAGREPRRSRQPRSSTICTSPTSGSRRDDPAITREQALDLARDVVNNARTELRPLNPPPGFEPAVRVDFARAVCAELEKRKRRLGILDYDDLLIAARGRAGGAGLACPGPHAAALVDRHGRRVPGHRPGAVAGDRPGVQRSVDGDPDR